MLEISLKMDFFVVRNEKSMIEQLIIKGQLQRLTRKGVSRKVDSEKYSINR